MHPPPHRACAQHDMAMREIADFYKCGHSRQPNQGTNASTRPHRTPQVPGLLRLHVWSDGQRSQYKGEKNFSRMSAWPKSVDAGDMQLEVHHYMYESHHASGPQDNTGKDPRRAMDAAILHEKSATIYDYHRCME